jgi:putative SOS response-associated peptidase YedK
VCGRTVFTLSKQRVADAAKVSSDRVDVPSKCYNAGPTFSLPCIIGADKVSRCVIPMTWGLKPRFKTETHLTTNNARTESVTTSKLYGHLLNKQRCVLMVDGFYEWKTEGSIKRPFLISNKPSKQFMFVKQEGESLADDTMPLLMAGLYDYFDGEYTFTVLTLDSTGRMASIHERMPLFLSKEGITTWLDTALPYETISKGLVVKAETLVDHLTFIEVSQIVNSIRNQSADCIIPKKDFEDKQFSQGLGRFFTKKRKDLET